MQYSPKLFVKAGDVVKEDDDDDDDDKQNENNNKNGLVCVIEQII